MIASSPASVRGKYSPIAERRQRKPPQKTNRPSAFANGRLIAVRLYGGTSPEALAQDRSLSCCGWSFGGVGRCLCCAMNASNSSLSLAWRRRSRKSRNSTCSSSRRRSVSMRYSSKARLPLEGGPNRRTEAAALHAAAHPLHLVLHPLHLVLPAILMTPATHFSAPECEKEKGKPDRPPDDEAEDGHGDPAGMPWTIEHVRAIGLFGGAAPSIDICGVGHFPLHDGNHAVVNVNNIYIPKPSRIFVKRAPSRRPINYFGVPQGPDGGTGRRTGGGF